MRLHGGEDNVRGRDDATPVASSDAARALLDLLVADVGDEAVGLVVPLLPPYFRGAGQVCRGTLVDYLYHLDQLAGDGTQAGDQGGVEYHAGPLRRVCTIGDRKFKGSVSIVR